MSRFFPHPPYAEDQPLHHTILTTHVLTRGFTAGAIVGSLASASRHVLSPARRQQPLARLVPRLLAASSTGALVGVGLSALATVGRMYGREEIEWRDRSWRLLENEGQLETDDWTYAGMVAGPAVLAATRGGAAAMGGWRAVVGASGLGSIAGMLGYMTWRYGINGGKFPKSAIAK